jgi:hypothetical protein
MIQARRPLALPQRAVVRLNSSSRVICHAAQQVLETCILA